MPNEHQEQEQSSKKFKSSLGNTSGMFDLPDVPDAPRETIKLESIVLDDEMGMLLGAAKRLVEDADKTDNGVPLNQRAQVVNSMSSLLTKIAATRTEVYNSERVRRMEQAIIRALKRVDRGLAEQILGEIDKELELV